MRLNKHIKMTKFIDLITEKSQCIESSKRSFQEHKLKVKVACN